MERRTRARRPVASSGVAAAPALSAAPLLANIAKLIEEGGHIMVGRVPPIDSAAIAYDGRKSLAMLRRQPAETVPQLLARLDQSIALAWTEHRLIDEINTAAPTSRRR